MPVVIGNTCRGLVWFREIQSGDRSLASSEKSDVTCDSINHVQLFISIFRCVLYVVLLFFGEGGVPGHVNFICRRFGTICSIFTTYDFEILCSETSAYRNLTVEAHLRIRIQKTLVIFRLAKRL